MSTPDNRVPDGWPRNPAAPLGERRFHPALIPAEGMPERQLARMAAEVILWIQYGGLNPSHN